MTNQNLLVLNIDFQLIQDSQEVYDHWEDHTQSTICMFLVSEMYDQLMIVLLLLLSTTI